jgi:hypothetical protein
VTEFLSYPEQSFVSLSGARVLRLFRAEDETPTRVAAPAGWRAFS